LISNDTRNLAAQWPKVPPLHLDQFVKTRDLLGNTESWKEKRKLEKMENGKGGKGKRGKAKRRFFFHPQARRDGFSVTGLG